MVPIFSVKLEPYFFLIGTVFLDLGSQLDGQGEPPLTLVGLLPSGSSSVRPFNRRILNHLEAIFDPENIKFGL